MSKLVLISRVSSTGRKTKLFSVLWVFTLIYISIFNFHKYKLNKTTKVTLQREEQIIVSTPLVGGFRLRLRLQPQTEQNGTMPLKVEELWAQRCEIQSEVCRHALLFLFTLGSFHKNYFFRCPLLNFLRHIWRSRKSQSFNKVWHFLLLLLFIWRQRSGPQCGYGVFLLYVYWIRWVSKGTQTQFHVLTKSNLCHPAMKYPKH